MKQQQLVLCIDKLVNNMYLQQKSKAYSRSYFLSTYC